MPIQIIRAVLAWCSAIDLALLIVWYLFFTLAHGSMYRFHTKWFKKLSVEAFDAIHCGSMAVFKIEILLFNYFIWGTEEGRQATCATGATIPKSRFQHDPE